MLCAFCSSPTITYGTVIQYHLESGVKIERPACPTCAPVSQNLTQLSLEELVKDSRVVVLNDLQFVGEDEEFDSQDTTNQDEIDTQNFLRRWLDA